MSLAAWCIYITTTLFISYVILGSVAFASLKKGKNCLVVDTNWQRLRAIRQKLEEGFALWEKETRS